MLALIILCILLTWLLCAAVCIGNGFLLLRGLRFTCSLTEALWTGLALITAILQLYHFFRPIHIVAVFLLVGLSLAGWIWNYAVPIPDAFAGQGSLLRRPGDGEKSYLSTLIFYVPATIIIAFRCAALGEHYDTGLYGAQAVRWFITYPLVPGLSNLMAQLGYDSSVFLCIAALDHGPWRDLAHHFFVGFLIAAFFLSIIPAALRVFRSEFHSSIDWFLTLLFIPATIWASTAKIVGTNTDLPTSIVCLVAITLLFRALDEESPLASASDLRAKNLLIAMALFSLAVTFKMSIVVFASLGWVLAVLKLWPLTRSSATGKRRLALAVILSAAIVLPWIGRRLVLTGYPFFPNTAFSIPVEWKVPASEAQMQADFARSFARVPELTSEYAHGWRWLRPWFREMLTEREGFVIPLLFVLVGGATGIIGMRRPNRRLLPQWLWLLAPTLGGMIFWFLEAPAIRFGAPVIWTAAATLGTFTAVHFLNNRGRVRVALAVMVLLTAWAAHPRLFWSSYFRPSVGVRAFLRLPEAKLRQHQTISGLTVNVPMETNQCWNAPLPCSFYFRDTLHLREPGKPERGFVSDASGAIVKWE